MSPHIAAVLIVCLWAFWAFGFHIKYAPTEDQLYGCTVEQQAPNGECK